MQGAIGCRPVRHRESLSIENGVMTPGSTSGRVDKKLTDLRPRRPSLDTAALQRTLWAAVSDRWPSISGFADLTSLTRKRSSDSEPRRYGAHWGALGQAPASLSTTFVSKAALGGVKGRTRSGRRFVAVEGSRLAGRQTLERNRAVLPIEVDPGDGTVTLEGRVLAVDPVSSVPLSRRYLLG
jgi:hypothetical protein